MSYHLSWDQLAEARRRDPILAVLRTLGERISELDDAVRMYEANQKALSDDVSWRNREIEQLRVEKSGVEVDRDRWRDRAVAAETTLRDRPLSDEVVAVLAAARAVLESPTNHQRRKLRLALAELDREETL